MMEIPKLPDLHTPIYSTNTVLRVARIDRATLDNWLRFNIKQRWLEGLEAPGRRKPRKFSADLVFLLAAMKDLTTLGIKASEASSAASVASSNAAIQLAQEYGLWGDLREETKDLHRWMAVYRDPVDGLVEWAQINALPDMRNVGTSVMMCIDTRALAWRVYDALSEAPEHPPYEEDEQ